MQDETAVDSSALPMEQAQSATVVSLSHPRVARGLLNRLRAVCLAASRRVCNRLPTIGRPTTNRGEAITVFRTVFAGLYNIPQASLLPPYSSH